MQKFVILGNWTEQGIKSVKETTARAAAAEAAATAMGGKLDIMWTMGRYDIVGVGELPTIEQALGLLVTLGMQGNIETETLPAWGAADIDKVLNAV